MTTYYLTLFTHPLMPFTHHMAQSFHHDSSLSNLFAWSVRSLVGYISSSTRVLSPQFCAGQFLAY